MTTIQPGSPAPVVGSFPTSDEEVAARVKALESLLIEKGLMSELAVDALAEMYNTKPVTLIRAIYSRPATPPPAPAPAPSPMQAFADAFRLRREER